MIKRMLQLLKLYAREATDLIIFVESLTNFSTQWRGKNPGEGPPCH